MNGKLLQNFHVLTRRAMQSFGTNWIVVSHFFPQKIGEFLSSGPEGLIFKPQEFYFVTLTSHANVGLKLNAAFQTSTPRICQFVPRGQKESKYQILFPFFVWKVNCLNKMTFTGVLLCDTERLCKVWAKIVSCFLDRPKKDLINLFQANEKCPNF